MKADLMTHCITCGGFHDGEFCPRTKEPTYSKPTGVILVSHDSIEVRQLHPNGFTETHYPEPSVENLNDAARVLGRWLNLTNESPPFPELLHHSFPPLPPLFKTEQQPEPFVLIPPTPSLTVAELALDALNEQERLDVMSLFCRHCGCRQPETSCQCWNDE
jgi:hypothetical protein